MDTKHISIQIWSDDNNFLNCEEDGKVERKQKGKEPKRKGKGLHGVFKSFALRKEKKKF